MFGVNDPWVLLGYGATLLFALACVLYGLVNWNKGGE